MRLVYEIAAALALASHLAWILFLVFGGWIFRRHFWIRVAHLAGVAAAIAMGLLWISCPLTHLEQEFRRRAGLASYAGSFVMHYLETVIYPDLPFWVFNVALGVLAAWNVVVYVRWPFVLRTQGKPLIKR